MCLKERATVKNIKLIERLQSYIKLKKVYVRIPVKRREAVQTGEGLNVTL